MSKNIYQRIIEVQKKVTTILKNETVKMHENDKGYKAVTHDDVAAALHIPLAEAGIVVLPEVTEFQNSSFDKSNKYGNQTTWYRTDIKIKVKWINADDPNDFIESNGAAFALDTSDKSFAKAYSLALKIVLLKVHLLESRDNEEQRPFDNDNTPHKQNKGGYDPNKSRYPKNADETMDQLAEKSIVNHAPPPETPQQRLVRIVKEKNIPFDEVPELIYRCTGEMNKKSSELSADEIQSVINYINLRG